MAPLVSPFCSPLSSTRQERAGEPAGKHNRPIVAWPYSRWTNHRRARRVKMNSSLSPPVLLFLRSSLSAILRTHFPHLDFTSRSLARSRIYPACSVRPTVRTFASCQCSRARHVALYLATFQRLTRYFPSFSTLFHSSALFLSLARARISVSFSDI